MHLKLKLLNQSFNIEKLLQAIQIILSWPNLQINITDYILKAVKFLMKLLKQLKNVKFHMIKIAKFVLVY